MTKETYEKSVNILLDAYNAGKLFHGNCDHCAVGNLLGTSVWVDDFCTVGGTLQVKMFNRKNMFSTAMNEFIQPMNRMSYSETEKVEARNLLDGLYSAGGYTKTELMEIEWAFENSIALEEEGYSYYVNKNGCNDDRRKKGQFIGLTAVLKLMATMVEEEVVDHQPRLQEIYNRKMEEINA